MAKGREESDDRVVPQGCRKAVVTQGKASGGGKAVTASQEGRQLELICETADSPEGADGVKDRGRPRPRAHAVPKSHEEKGPARDDD